MFEESDRIMNIISQANILNQQDIATIERGLKLQESYEIMINESLRLGHSNVFDLKYQNGMPRYKTIEKVGFCKDCASAIKLSTLPGQESETVVRYQCGRYGTYTKEFNSCVHFEKY